VTEFISVSRRYSSGQSGIADPRGASVDPGRAPAEAYAASPEDSLRRILAATPGNADALCALAELQLTDGRLQRARRNLSKALAAEPNHLGSLLAFGRLARRQDREPEAIEVLARALTCEPKTSAQLEEVARQALTLGAVPLVLDAYGHLLSAEPGKRRHWRGLAEVLRFVRVDRHDPDFERLLLGCMTSPDLDHQDLAGCTMSLLAAKRSLAPFFDVTRRRARGPNWGPATIDALRDPLLIALLNNAIACDQEFEGALTAWRRLLLCRCLEPGAEEPPWPAVEPFAAALATQCFLNEYVFAVTQEEEELVEEALRVLGAGELTPRLRVLWAMVASYRPLHRVDGARRLTGLGAEDQGALRRLGRLQIEEPRMEERLRASLPCLTAVTDGTSLAVRTFYEETPYPRWSSLKRMESTPAARFLAALFPSRAALFASFPAQPKVLVAGCGTGRHALLTAQFFADAEVLGIDLSRASLAYALRKARDLGMGNIRRAQADLLNIDESLGRFDIIECSGVLVCVADPLAGLRNLADRLRPEGVIKLGLYSAAARRHVVRAREFIAERGFESTPQGIRQCRQAIKESDDPLLRRIAVGRDFFSISMVRDLIFHIQEHRFTIDWIEAAAGESNLDILGFEISYPVAARRYRRIRPHDRDRADLDGLRELEAAYPETFSEMYQVWLRKPGP